MLWKEFKTKLESMGIQDEDFIQFLSVDDTLDKIEDLNEATIQMVGPSSNENPVSCWEVYV